MTRELKLALIVGVTLVLGVAVLVSDHLATKRRPRLETEVAVQPAMTPPPAPIPAPLPAPVAVAEPGPVEPSGPVLVAHRETQPPVTEIEISTPGVSGKGPEAPAPKQADAPQRLVGPTPLIKTRPTSSYNGGEDETTLAAVKTHTVAEGDSAYKIAKKYLGDGSQWKKIVDANPKSFGPEGQVKVGVAVVIPMAEAPKAAPLPIREPPVLAKAPASKPETQKAEPKKPEPKRAEVASKAGKETNKGVKSGGKPYTVKPGDTLSSIARRELGSTARATEIAELNKSLIKDPDSLPLGAAIRLPAG